MYDIAAHGFAYLGFPMILSEPGSKYGDGDDSAHRWASQRHPGARARETMHSGHLNFAVPNGSKQCPILLCLSNAEM